MLLPSPSSFGHGHILDGKSPLLVGTRKFIMYELISEKIMDESKVDAKEGNIIMWP